MRLALLLGTSAFVAAAACSCSSLEGIASEPSASPDSGSDGSSAGDGTAASDASTGPDANVDGGADAATGFCASLNPAPTFCLDFDDGAPLSSALTESIAPVAPATFDTTNPKSPPRAFSMTAGGDAGTFSSWVKKELGGAPNVIDISFDLAIEAAQLFALEIETHAAPAPVYRFQLQPGNESFYYAEKIDDTTVADQSLAAVPASWEHFRFVLDFTTRRYSLWVGLAKLLDEPMAMAGHTGSLLFRFGALYHSGSFSLRLDNLVIDAK
jgi:hypothetical protein